VQPVDARWRHGGEWTVRVRYRPLNDDTDDASSWKELLASGESTSTIVDSLATDRQYVIVVDARNQVGYNMSLTAQRILIPDAETGMRYADNLRSSCHSHSRT